MKKPLRDIQVLGIHPVWPTSGQFQEALDTQWGSNLPETELETARKHVREHFEGLYLIEVQLHPPNAKIDWAEFTQPLKDVPQSNWQVPYDERPIDETTRRWAFFLHFVDLNKSLSTPVGDRPLPSLTSIPSHLTSVHYEVPG